MIGAGQAGLSTAYHLARRGQDFVVLDAYERVGDNWRCHWDSLRLYSPALGGLAAGHAVPGAADVVPDQGRDGRLPRDLPGAVRPAGARRGPGGERAGSRRERYLVTCTDGSSYACDNVVVATGTFGRTPSVPAFAGDLDPAIRQLHSSDYKRPAQLQPGGVLVVGASHSGGDIAFEAGDGRSPGRAQRPRSTARSPSASSGRSRRSRSRCCYFVARHVLTLRTPLGRKIRPEIRAHGGPLIRVKKSDLARVGVEMAEPRTVGVRDGRPVLADDRVLDVANVVWCTGFRQDFSWIELPVTGDDGWPLERRGVVESAPGLYFVGLAFQFAFSSMLVGGAGRDAEYVVRHLAARTPAPHKGRRGRSPVSAA